LPAVLASVLVLLQASGFAPVLRYERLFVAHGEPWRLITGNFVHLGWHHLLLNLTGLVLIQALFADRIGSVLAISVVVVASVCVGVGLHYLSGLVPWYVGFSGVLHGWFAAGAILLLVERPRSPVLAALLLVALIAKLVGEQFGLALFASSDWLGGAAVVEAHLYGALGGAFVGGLYSIFKKQGPPIGGP
jgi:rhomboid family GlyGly-CTERM serine protease